MKNISVLVFLFLVSFLSAQDVVNPLDAFYQDVEIWENRGLVHNLPHARPYPLFVIKKILDEVDEKGSSSDKARSSYYRQNWQDEGFDVYQELSVTNRNKDFNLYENQVKEVLALGGYISPNLSFNFNGYVYAWDKTDGIHLPRGTARADDLVEDAAGFTAFGRTVDLRGSVSTLLAYGQPDFFITAGMHRSDFGPFYFNGAILSGQAPYAPTINLHWEQNWVSLDYIYKGISASNSLNAVRRYPEKHFVTHELAFKPFPEIWEFSVVETMIFGKRLDVLYFIPVSLYFFNQAIFGFSDNNLIGLTNKLRLAPGVQWNSLFYLDDYSMNDVMRLKLFETKFKVALQSNLTWTPENNPLQMLQLEYLLVAPYMYTHVFDDNGADDPWKTDSISGSATGALEPNYLNYTHMGRNLGPALEPNSDRITLKSLFRFADWMDLGVWGRVIRHGNASWDRTWINNDGSIFDDGYNNEIKDGGYQFEKSTPFLSQPVIEWVFIAGTDFRYKWDIFPNQSLQLGIPLILQKIANKNFQPGLEETSVFTELNLRYIFRY